MEKQNSSIETKLQPVNPAYSEIIKLLKVGGNRIRRDLRRSREARFCHEVQMAREHLKLTLKSVPATPGLRHIQQLASAIQNVIYQLKSTQEDFHSKGLLKIRESADELLKEAKKILRNN